MPGTVAVGHKKNVVQEAEICAVVTRCGCGNPDSHNGVRGPSGVCPKPRAVEDLGRISYWHRSWLKRLAWWFSQKFGS